MQGFGLVVDCSAPRCVDKAFLNAINVSIYCDSALPLAKSQRVLRALRVLIDAPAAHMQTNIGTCRLDVNRSR